MIFLGILAWMQILLLPGVLALRWVRAGGSLLQRVIYAVGISLIMNFLLVFLLTAMHLYLQPVMLVVIACEVAAILYFYREELRSPVRVGVEALWVKFTCMVTRLVNPDPGKAEHATVYLLFRKAALVLSFFIAVNALVHMGQILIQNVPSVFNTYDAIVSWNQWATEWARNSFPAGTQDYPQLGPVMFSLTYVITGAVKVQLFAKALMPLFLTLMMLMFFDLALEKPSYGIFLGVQLVYLVVKHFVGEYIVDGYMDIPLAFFAFLGVYAILKSRLAGSERENMVNLFLGFFFAAGAAITKQAGIYMLVVTPLLAGFIHGWKHLFGWARRNRRVVILGLLAAALVVIPWYAMKLIQINTGVEATHLMTPISDTSAKFGTLSIAEKVASGLLSLGKYALGFLFILPALFLMDPAIRWITLLIVLPFTVLWAGYASYDVRNVTLVWPFFSLAIAVSLEAYLEWFFKLGARIFKQHQLRWWGLAIIGLALGVAASLLVPSEKLVREQETLQKQILNPSLNQQLYDYFDQNPSTGRIAGSYPVEYLPGFEGRQLYFGYNSLQDFEWVLRQDKVKFLLVPNYARDEIRQRLREGVTSGEFTLIFSNDRFIPQEFYIINN